jgi:hypothetical protein
MSTIDSATFARNLVKGKIAETVFAQMLRETDEFTVMDFGYEKVLPEVMHRGAHGNTEVIETLRSAPDFAVINRKTRKVHLIEVKYMRQLNVDRVYEYAERMARSWNPSFMFVATLEGFFFDEIDSILLKNGNISRLHHLQISKEVQEKYHKILRDFEAPNS